MNMDINKNLTVKGEKGSITPIKGTSVRTVKPKKLSLRREKIH